ncbi:cytochrome b [Marinivivus vitaminiproducens]|uniref:cytochrome b n=1 Tax=Marinivivus vitaminiproducens TaxID=3035935 RepID=UPI00279AC52B|nr:cytochrome b N-terminal domain-containing protein [Geminicoccaceae bacterium SCSIO 64248]
MANPGARREYDNPVIKWVEHRLPVFSTIEGVVGRDYPTPKNLNYFWNFGALAGLALVIQIVTGIVLAMHYTPHTAYAFTSVEHIMRDVNFGWLLRYAHANGASMFFIVVYIHIARGLYYGSYKMPRELLWMLGVVIFLLMMATAFMGYVLPWGQMSFWGATVITNLFSALPIVGETLVTWLWGGFSVDNPTLNRFFSLHYLLPFMIAGVVVLHVLALHEHGSNNPLGIDRKSPKDSIPFHPYYTVKDAFGVGVFLIVFAIFVFFAPNVLGHPDNYIPANPLSTPSHIVPEWYFLPFYAMLRSITFNVPVMPFLAFLPDLLRLALAILSLLGVLAALITLGIATLRATLISLAITFVGVQFLFGYPIPVNLAIDAKLGGVIAMFGSILILFVLPWLDTSRVRSATFRPVFFWVYWLLIIDMFVLGYVGSQPAEGIWPLVGLIGTIYYFVHFLIILPLLGVFERPLPLPESISKPVLPSTGGASLQPAE